MRVILSGGRSFGVAVLNMMLEEGHDVAGTITEDIKMVEAASDAGIRSNLLEGGSNRDLAAHYVRVLDADVIVNAHGTSHVTLGMLQGTRYGAIGYHPSLLPRHRGRSAVEWTIAMRDPIAGGTVYQLDDGWDTGPIIKQDFCHVRSGWTASDLWRERLFPMGVDLIRQVLREADWGPERWPTTPGEPQDDAVATYEAPWPPKPRCACYIKGTNPWCPVHA